MAEGHTIAERAISDKDLLYMSRNIGKDWDNLAPYLDISSVMIQQIKLGDPFQPQDHIYKMLLKWRQQSDNTKVTVASLLVKMHEAEECVSIDWIELYKEFCKNELEPHQDVLQKALKQFKIHLEPGTLLDCLHTRGVLRSKMVNRIKEFGKTEKSNELMQYIYTKNCAEYSKFKECLVECGQGHLSDYLIELERGTGLEHAEVNLRQRLQDYDTDRHTGNIAGLKKNLQKDLINEYRKTCSKLQMSQLFDGCTADLKEFYVLPTLTCLQLICNVPEKKSKPVKSYHDVFTKNSKKCQHIYISSEAGCGKTSLVKWMALNWCHAHEPVESDNRWFRKDNIDELRQFTFMFIFYLRDAPKDLCEIDIMIQKQFHKLPLSGMYSKLDLESVQRLLSNERCLIVMDGLDEWSHPQSNGCEKTNKQVPHSKAWQLCTILITTRPWKLDITKLTAEDGEEIDHTLKLFGLEENLVGDLIDKVVNRMNELLSKEKKAVEFKELLRDKKLNAVCKIPIMVMLLLALWFDDEAFETSWCKIYCSMTEFLLKLFYKKKRMPVVGTVLKAPAYLGNNMHCKAHMELLTDLGALAFYTLLGDSQELSLVFDEVVTEKFISDTNVKMALNVGILTQENRIDNISQGSSSYMCFLHKTIQEFLAALYIGEQVRTRDLSAVRTTIENFCFSIEKILEMSQVFMFLSGLCPEIMSHLSEHLKQVVSADMRTQNYRSSCDRHPESSEGQLLGKLQYTMMTWSQEGHMNNHMKVNVPVMDVFIVNPNYGRHFPSWYRWSDELKFMVANISVSTLSVHGVKKAKVLEDIMKYFSEFISVKKLWLSLVPGKFVVEILRYYMNVTLAKVNLECLVLKRVTMSFDNLQSIVNHVIQLPLSVKVRLWNCSITGSWRPFILRNPYLIVDRYDDDDGVFNFDILFHTAI